MLDFPQANIVGGIEMERASKKQLDSLSKSLFTLMISTGSEDLIEALLDQHGESESTFEYRNKNQPREDACR